MPYGFRLPDIGEGVAEGEVVKWFVAEGATVAEDAPLVSVLTDKANVEIPSPKAGRIVKLHAQVGDKVKVGGLLVTIEPTGGATPPSAGSAPASAPATLPPTTPAGATAAVPGRTSEAASAPGAGSSPASSARPLASPAVRRLAAERGIDLATVRGSGPGGRVTEADLAPAAGSTVPPVTIASPEPSAPAASTSPATLSPIPAAPGAPAAVATAPGDERLPLRGVRRVIAEHMAQSVHTAAHYTYVEEIDASELVRVRERMAKHVERNGVKLSYLPFIVKAVVAGLRSHPMLNATMDDARQELVVRKAINIGVALAAPDGLMVPVLHGADHKSLTQIAKEVQDLAERGRAGKLTRAELTGGTFTITSLGALGGVMATPILNYPEVGILGVHKIVRRPVYKSDGSLGPADLMNLSVSLDHRVLDGILAAQFLSVVKSNLEDPHLLFAELA